MQSLVLIAQPVGQAAASTAGNDCGGWFSRGAEAGFQVMQMLGNMATPGSPCWALPSPVAKGESKAKRIEGRK